MRLIENKEDIAYNKVSNNIYWIEDNISDSDWGIWGKQEINTYQLITSNNVIENIYHEIIR
jgi:hypothetical protein